MTKHYVYKYNGKNKDWFLFWILSLMFIFSTILSVYRNNSVATAMFSPFAVISFLLACSFLYESFEKYEVAVKKVKS